jgi:predicted DNA-binding protein
MLSVRLPESLQCALDAYCATQHLTKSAVVQRALEQHLSTVTKSSRNGRLKKASVFDALRGIGNKKLSTDEIMRMTRGNDWNKP